MKKMYVVTMNMVIVFTDDVKAHLELIGVFDTKEKAKQAAIEYSKHQVTDEPLEDQEDLAEGIHELVEINEIELNKLYPKLEMSYERY